MHYIDYHSHIIPNVDDGSDSFEESIKMIKQAEGQGISVMYATPHLVINDSTEEVCDTILSQFTAIKRMVNEQSINVELKLGYELYCSKSIIYKTDFKRYCLENTNQLLIEVSPSSNMDWLIDFVYELSLQNIEIILAHPERYKSLINNRQFIEELKKYNVRFQINSGSIIGIYGRKLRIIAKNMIKNNYMDLIGTDSHYAGHKGLNILEAKIILYKWIGKDLTEKILKKK